MMSSVKWLKIRMLTVTQFRVFGCVGILFFFLQEHAQITSSKIFFCFSNSISGFYFLGFCFFWWGEGRKATSTLEFHENQTSITSLSILLYFFIVSSDDSTPLEEVDKLSYPWWMHKNKIQQQKGPTQVLGKLCSRFCHSSSSPSDMMMIHNVALLYHEWVWLLHSLCYQRQMSLLFNNINIIL